ncbi:MAG: 50S ribosomal protein L4 [Chloroflexi bacterium]|nr:50S ribosomal protein L4 [Chloroflexota bacterium]
MHVSVLNTSGVVIGERELDEKLFGVPFHRSVVHQALVRQLANARQGTADTETRGQVAGSTAKIRRQKGTGRARQGSARAPHRRGGGVAFGPHPRDFSQAMPKKMRRLALKALLSAKAEEERLLVLDDLSLERPKTKDMVVILASLGVKSSALIVTAGPDVNVYKSARNLPKIKALPAPLLNVVDLLSHDTLIITQSAVLEVERIWGQGRGG